jgi:hypothetical protein
MRGQHRLRRRGRTIRIVASTSGHTRRTPSSAHKSRQLVSVGANSNARTAGEVDGRAGDAQSFLYLQKG